MTAPKVYVPAPGRPPEWVVDLMVEGRIGVQIINGHKLYCCAEEARFTPTVAWEGQAIRLNEDGSLEIIDAPKEEPKQWWTCGDAEIVIKTHGSRAKLSFQIDAGWRTLNELLDLAKQHTEDPEDIAGIARETWERRK